MYQTRQNATYPVSTRQSALPAGAAAAMGLAGAMIAGSGAAAKDARLVKAGAMTGAEAAGDVVKEALGGGLSTAAGAAAAGAMFRSGAAALLAMALVSAGVKYLYDGMTASARPALSPAQKAPAENTPAKSAKKS